MRVIAFFMSAALGCSANSVMNAQESRKALVDSITPARESSPDTTWMKGMLTDVVVKGKRPLVRQEEDRMVFDVSRMKDTGGMKGGMS